MILAPLTMAHADQIVLNNGDVISGTVREMSEQGGVQLASAFGQTLYVPWGNIADIRNGAGETMDIFPPYWNGPRTQDAAVLTGTPAASAPPITAQAPMASNDAVTLYSLDDGQPLRTQGAPLALAQNAPAALPRVATATEEASPEEDTAESGWLGAEWSGRVNAGANLSEGNTDKKALVLDGEAKAKWGDVHRAYVKAEYQYEEDENVTTEDEQSLDLGYDYFFQPKWFVNTHAEFEKDDLSDLDLRSIYGVALGYQPYESDALNLSMRLGPNYLREEYANGETEDSLAAGWAFDYDQKVWDEALQLFHNHQLDVPVDETKSYVFESQTGVRLPIKNGIIGTAQIDYDRDNDPASGAEKDDTEYSLKLGYEW